MVSYMEDDLVECLKMIFVSFFVVVRLIYVLVDIV